VAVKAKGLVLAPDELAERLGSAFVIEVLRRSVEPADDPGMRRLGITRVAKTWYWLARKPAGSGAGRHPGPSPRESGHRPHRR
jgi:hypothetical protein